jgi:diamine N-acetyltransferase
VQITSINTPHAKELSDLAKSIYKEYYLHLWHPGGAEWYMDEYAYHPDKLRLELADTNNLHFIVYDNTQPMGYLKIRLHEKLQGYESINSLEIERIYLHKKVAGKGIGKQLMFLAEELAIQYKKEMVFLKAMDTSKEAIAFYKKNGYSICGTYILPFIQMKEEFRGMVILRKPLV